MAAIPDVHVNAVDAWLERAGASKSPRALLRAFDIALSGIRTQATQTLGTVTFEAIVDYLQIQNRLAGATYDELAHGARSILTEMLSLLSALTAGILTPQIHAELARMTGRDVDEWPQARALGVAT